jgi:hypothetical protein
MVFVMLALLMIDPNGCEWLRSSLPHCLSLPLTGLLPPCASDH